MLENHNFFLKPSQKYQESFCKHKQFSKINSNFIFRNHHLCKLVDIHQTYVKFKCIKTLLVYIAQFTESGSKPCFRQLALG